MFPHSILATPHSEAKHLNLGDDVLKPLEAEITKTVCDAIDARVKELMARVEEKKGRKHELETALRWAMESLFARIERGMTVEIRFIPPAESRETIEGGEIESVAPTVFEQLNNVSTELDFPALQGEPILRLPTREPNEAEKSRDTKK